MVFSSTTFLFILLPVFLLIVLLARGSKAANWLLLAISLIFYAWGEPVYVLLMIFSVLTNYLLTLPAERFPSGRKAVGKLLLCLAVSLNIGMLCLFKYAGFLVGSVNGLLGASIPVPEIALPIGISFFTFQVLSYVIDAYRGEIKPQRSFMALLLYVSFFPQLIAGPIVRYSDIEKQLFDREINITRAAQGLRRFIIGLSKKLLLANCFGQLVDNAYGCSAEQLSMPLAWLAAICYCLQIYFDFSGYSDMAIGLGKVAGFDFNENFNYPFAALSMKDFWRRWHISLSTWFREYVYIPLGGNRKGRGRTCLNKIIVFLLTGLWHGAQWTFVVWGLLHGLLLLLEGYDIISPSKWKFKPLRWLYTAVCVCITFVIFRAESFAQAWNMLKAMFMGPFSTATASINLTGFFSIYNIIILCIGAAACTPVLRSVKKRVKNERVLDYGGYAAAVLLAVLCIFSVSTATYNPFIYFRF